MHHFKLFLNVAEKRVGRFFEIRWKRLGCPHLMHVYKQYRIREYGVSNRRVSGIESTHVIVSSIVSPRFIFFRIGSYRVSTHFIVSSIESPRFIFFRIGSYRVSTFYIASSIVSPRLNFFCIGSFRVSTINIVSSIESKI